MRFEDYRYEDGQSYSRDVCADYTIKEFVQRRFWTCDSRPKRTVSRFTHAITRYWDNSDLSK